MATLILKATERCNSNCYYCDVVRKEGAGASMPLELLDLVYVRADEYLRGHPGETLEMIWHGGEPLLLGADYFREALAIQRRRCPQTAGRIEHALQTNLTCLDQELVAALRQLGITSLGTSYDVEAGMRGPGPTIDTAWYNRRFMRGLELLERNGVGWGMIYVVTRRSLARPLELFYLLTNLLLSGGINFNPVLIYDDERQDVAITPEEFVGFLGAIFPAWWNHRARYPDVQPFRSLVESVIEGRISLGCVESGDCTYHHINIAPDGETSQCGRSADWGLLQYGNIADRSFDLILADEQRDALAARVELLRDGECAGCRFWDLCHGGCPLDAWSSHRDFMHRSEWCEARRGFIERHFEPVTGAVFQPRAGAE